MKNAVTQLPKTPQNDEYLRALVSWESCKPLTLAHT